MLCDVIGQTGADNLWRRECFRVVADHERPLVLQSLWKPKDGFSRRFEIQLRASIEEQSSREQDTVTAGTPALPRPLPAWVINQRRSHAESLSSCDWQLFVQLISGWSSEAAACERSGPTKASVRDRRPRSYLCFVVGGPLKAPRTIVAPPTEALQPVCGRSPLCCSSCHSSLPAAR